MLHLLIMSESIELPDVMNDEDEPDIVFNAFNTMLQNMVKLKQDNEDLDREAN